MNRRTIARVAAAAVLVVAAAVALFYWLLRDERWVVRLSAAEIQASLDARFPVEKTHLKLFTVRYSRPRVRLEEGADRIHAGVDGETLFSLNDRAFTGSADVSGLLEYDPGTGEFRLRDARVDRLSIGGVPEKHAGLVTWVGNRLLQGHLDRHPVYRLRPTDVKHALARLVLRKVEVRDGNLEITLGLGP